MPKIKVPRKSTAVDMTAMCDVAFLLLSFFILTSKFKPSEELSVVTPSSVATETALENDVVLITMDAEGRAYFSVSDDAEEQKRKIIEEVNSERNLNLTDAEKAGFLRAGSYVGVPFSQLKSFLSMTAKERTQVELPGIPIDSANNELRVWLKAAQNAFMGQKMNLMLKGDNEAKYPTFKGVLDALKANDMLKFQLITSPDAIPEGTEFYRIQQLKAKGIEVSDGD